MTARDGDVLGADLPASALAVLADLRREPGITVVVDSAGDRVWVRWEPALAAQVVTRVRPVVGATLHVRRGGLWYGLDARLPAFDRPADDAEAVRLDRALVPAPLRAEPPGPATEPPATLRLARDDRPRPAGALACRLDVLALWAETATTAQLSALRAARAGDRLLVRGHPLPPLIEATRFWGDRVWTPLGLRPEPDLPESALREALGIDPDALLILAAEGFEQVPLAAFERLSRGAVRLAIGSRGGSS